MRRRLVRRRSKFSSRWKLRLPTTNHHIPDLSGSPDPVFFVFHRLAGGERQSRRSPPGRSRIPTPSGLQENCHPERGPKGRVEGPPEASSAYRVPLWCGRLARTIQLPSTKCGRDARTTKPTEWRTGLFGRRLERLSVRVENGLELPVAPQGFEFEAGVQTDVPLIPPREGLPQ